MVANKNNLNNRNYNNISNNNNTNTIRNHHRNHNDNNNSNNQSILQPRSLPLITTSLFPHEHNKELPAVIIVALADIGEILNQEVDSPHITTHIINKFPIPPFYPRTVRAPPVRDKESMLAKGWLATKGSMRAPGIVVTNTGDKQWSP